MTKLRLRTIHLLLNLLFALFTTGCTDEPRIVTENDIDADLFKTTSKGEDIDEVAAGSSSRAPRIVHVATGESHTVLLGADGSVWTCGNGGDGQLGWEQNEECFYGVRVRGLPKITDVAAGTAFSIFLAEDGELWGAGYGFDERLGPTDERRYLEPVALGIGGLVDVAAYTNFTLGRRTDGTVISFGVNDAGGLGNGSPKNSAMPVDTGVRAIAIDAGGGYALALTEGGNVMSWGANNYGTLGNPSVPTMSMSGSVKASVSHPYSLAPVDVHIDRVIAISAGTEHALAVRDDGTVWGWGRNLNDGLAQARNNALYSTPVQVPGLSDIVVVAVGTHYSLALDTDGQVFTWGYNSNGQLGRAFNGRSSPAPGVVPGLPPIARIVAGKQHAFAIDKSGNAWSWGANQFGELASEQAEIDQRIPSPVTLKLAD